MHADDRELHINHDSIIFILRTSYLSLSGQLIPVTYIYIHLNSLLQIKCEQYWHDQVDKPFDAGRGFTVVTTAYRGFADYDVRELTVQCVS